MSLTTDPQHPGLKRGVDDKPVKQNEAYLVLTDRERANGFVKPYREAYKHLECGNTTSMDRAIAETYARDPYFYGATYCVQCQKHRPLSEFVWEPDGETMDPHKWPEEEHQRIAALRAKD
jgi:hypothetical protein